MNSTHEYQSAASPSADDRAASVARVEYQAPTLLRLDLACVIAGVGGGSQYDDDYTTWALG